MDMYKHLYVQTSLTFILEGWRTGNRMYNICIAPFASTLFILHLEKVGHTLILAVKVIFSWLISVHRWFVYWKWVPLFEVGSLSLQFLRQQTHIYHVLLLVHCFFCFNEILFARDSSQNKASGLPGDLGQLGFRHACTHRSNYVKMSIVLRVHPKEMPDLSRWSQLSVKCRWLRVHRQKVMLGQRSPGDPRAENGSFVWKRRWQERGFRGCCRSSGQQGCSSSLLPQDAANASHFGLD